MFIKIFIKTLPTTLIFMLFFSAFPLYPFTHPQGKTIRIRRFLPYHSTISLHSEPPIPLLLFAVASSWPFGQSPQDRTGQRPTALAISSTPLDFGTSPTVQHGDGRPSVPSIVYLKSNPPLVLLIRQL